MRVWDVVGGHELRTLSGHNASVLGLAFSSDNRRLATCSEDRTVKLWDLQTGMEIVTLRGHPDKVYGVAFDHEGWRLVSGSADGTIKIWEAISEQDCLTLAGHDNTIFSVAFSPDGTRLASGGNDRTVRLWDTDSGLELLCLFGHTARVLQVAFRPDGRFLASASAARRRHGSVFPGDIKIWDATAGRELRTLGNHTGDVNGLAFCRDGRLASTEEDGTVRVYELATGHILWSISAHSKPVRDVAFSLDGKLLATCSGGLDKSGKPLPGEVRLWDAATGREVVQLASLPISVHRLAFSHDSQLLAGAGFDGSLRIWDVGGRQEKLVLRGHTRPLLRVAFSPDDRRIGSASLDHTFKMWDVVTGMEMLSFPAHPVAVMGLGFSPDGLRLASSGYDRAIKLWDATPCTPEKIEQREALSLVAFLFAKRLSALDISARIHEDASINEAVRRRALAFVEPYDQNLRRQAAFFQVWEKINNGLTKQDLRDAIRQDKTIAEPLRDDALRLIERYPENVRFLHWCSRAAVSCENLQMTEYKLALRQAEAASRAEPANAAYLTTLGMARYRLGMFADGLNTLTCAMRSNNTTIRDPVNLAVQAMVSFRLGQKDEARNRLRELRELLKGPNAVENEEAEHLLREAARLIEQTK